MDSNPADIQSEIVRRQKATSRTVIGLMIAAVLLSLLAFLIRERLIPHASGTLDIPIRITILTLGLGSIVWRRTKFQAMRLQDIGALQGGIGLLKTLERTTLQLVILAGVISLLGLTGMYLLANEYYTYMASGVSLIVLIYAYPIRSSWEKTIARFADKSPAK